MKSHCNHPARERSCCLRNIQRQTRDRDYVPGPGQCDECMDSYLWFFEALKRKAGAFRGTNGCSLKTYVWAVLHSKTTYIDWLRWRYGRAF
jgi:hypothetical protein